MTARHIDSARSSLCLIEPISHLLPLAGEGRDEGGRLKFLRFRINTSSLCLVICIGMLTGCAIQPWVKPYEREHLADPIMKLSRDSLPEKHFEHVRSVREGAHGATGVQGGGCGCN